MARAKGAEDKRDRALAADHQFETASAALQLGIVLASASVITGALWLAYTAAVLGLAGAALTVLAWAAPTMLHF